MPFQDSTNLYNTTKYIVDDSGDTPYSTIQSAIDAANTAGGGLVHIRTGTYTENLTLYDNITLQGVPGPIVGANTNTVIVGTHTPPATGFIHFSDLVLQSATDVLNSAAAGTTGIYIQNSVFSITNGYIANLPNWTGLLNINNCGENSTDNGIVNNTGGMPIFANNCQIGAGTGNTFTANGAMRFDLTFIDCPADLTGTGVFSGNFLITGSTMTIGGTHTGTIGMGSLIFGTITIADTATIDISDTTFDTGANQALIHNSANELSLSDVTIDSSNATPIGGAGAGNLLLGSVTYLDQSAIAGTITKSFASRLETGELKLDDADQGSLRVNAGVVSGINQQNILYVGKHGNDANDGRTLENAYLTFGAALAAAGATDGIMCTDSGIYTENLVDPTGIRIHAPNATLVGAHTMIDGSTWNFQHAQVAAGTIGFSVNTAGAETYLSLNSLVCAGNGIGIACLNGKMFIEINFIQVATGFAIGATTTDEVYINFEEIEITGAGTAFGIAAAGDINIIGECVEDAGAGTLFFAAGAASTIAATISKVEVAVLSNITVATNARLNVARLAGALAEVGAGTVDGIAGANRIDGVPIGAVTPSTGVFTAVTDTSRTQYAVAVYGAGGALDEVATIGNAGEVLTSNGAGAEPTWQAAAGIGWSVETGAAVAAAVNSGYISNRAGGVTYTIPTTAAVGSIIRICSIQGLSTIAQNAGESIVFGAFTTTVGVGGSLVATNVGDTIEIICTVADTTWAVLSAVGNWTVN